MHSTHNEGKSVVAERFIRTIKNKIYMYMTSISKNVCIDKLDDIVNEYNNTYHRRIKRKPIDAKDNTYINIGKEANDKDAKYKVGDHVRISIYKNIFTKGYTPNWSEEIFVLKNIKNTVPWTFRADKSRSIVIVKGRSMNTTPFSVSKASVQPEVPSPIPSIHSRPIKFLGRIIDGSISDRNFSAELKDKLLAGSSVIDRSHFTGTQKLWILQHLLIPRIQWPLLIYEIPISLAFKLEQKVSVFIRKWLHLHHSTSSLCFYSSASPCPLPIKSLSSALKASKISGHLLLRNSQDPLVSSCVPKLRTGTWKVEDAVLSCENDIKISQVCGNGHHNKHGLGYTTTPRVPKNQSSKHYRRYISEHHKTIDDTYAFSKAVQLQVQGQWTRWINYVQEDFSWASLMAMPTNLTSFCLASTYDTLPSPTDLKRWRITTEAMCTLCSKDVCTTAHILGACKVALQQGRYTFRHDTVLHQVIEALQTFISNMKEAVPISATSSVIFV